MCGIAVAVNGTEREVRTMGAAIRRRGITESITKVDNLHVYFTWLPIVNNDKQAGQPVRVGDWYVWLNGYISNYFELVNKYNLDMPCDSDTHALAAMLQRFKFGKLNELNGFFAVVAYNVVSKELTCFTDRYGIKQLYSYTQGNKKFICSEPKGLWPVMGGVQLVDHSVREWQYSLGVMNQHTIYKNIFREPSLPMRFPEVNKAISFDEAAVETTALLNKSFQRNITTATNAVFLSGGVDSGVLAKNLHVDYCFSMDYVEQQFSEIEGIKLNSKGKHHYTMICNEQMFNYYKRVVFDALDDLKAGSCYTNFALTEMASKFGVKVLYSGAGGDELFMGYTHRYDKPVNDVIKRVPELETVYWKGVSHSDYDWKFLRAVLVVEDRMAGHFTMETRYPLLDNNLVDYVLALPAEYRFNKRLLRAVCGLHTDVINGRKRGFSNPYMTNAQWTKHALDEISNRIHSL